MDQKGITSTSVNRWKEAQKAECNLWMKEGLWWASDRNETYSEKFNNYSAIKGRDFKKALEIGCGPFTNLRLISEKIKIESCDLLDPLINSYLEHPSCSYTKSRLFKGVTNPLGLRAWISRQLLKKGEFGRKLNKFFKYIKIGDYIPISNLFNVPAEDLLVDSSYDLVVSINVLEHCIDADRVIDNIASCILKGGILILNEHYYEKGKIPEEDTDPYHPLRVDGEYLKERLTNNFKPLLSVIKNELYEQTPYKAFYFIGEKL